MTAPPAAAPRWQALKHLYPGWFAVVMGLVLAGFVLSAVVLNLMLRRIAARPHAYVAQEMVDLSQAPTWSRTHERRLIARPVGLRARSAQQVRIGRRC